jgi:protein-tyrosine kinase
MNDIEARRRRVLGQIAEIKRIFFAIDHALQTRRPAAVLITSALSGEGKSLLASALASTTAHLDKHSVAVLDFNWYRPAIHHCFGQELIQPMEHVIQANIDELMVKSNDQIPNLLVAPIDHRDHSKMKGDVFGVINRLIEQAKKSYDLVIIDSASIFPTNRMMIDPVMLSAMVDGVVLVVQAGITPRQDVKRAYTIMQAAGANVIGVTVNRHQVPITRQ